MQWINSVRNGVTYYGAKRDREGADREGAASQSHAGVVRPERVASQSY